MIGAAIPSLDYVRGGSHAPLVQHIEHSAPELLASIRQSGVLRPLDVRLLHAQIKLFLELRAALPITSAD